MPRTKEFDSNAALMATLELFWRRGYEATLMQDLVDLVDHLGIGRASIYATFGSKHDLYLQTLDRYCAEIAGTYTHMLPQSGPTLPGVRAGQGVHRQDPDRSRAQGLF